MPRKIVGGHSVPVVPLSPCAAINFAEAPRQSHRRNGVRLALIKDGANVRKQGNANGAIFGAGGLEHRLQCLSESLGPSTPGKLRDGQQDFGNIVLTRRSP